MQLTTPIHLTPVVPQIEYESKIVLLGSCFASNIGRALVYFKFQETTNPFGVLFHPVAIEKLITRAINETWFTEADLFFDQEQWHCFEVHSQFSNISKEAILQQLNEVLTSFLIQLKEATHLVFTFGTSWVYRHIETDAIVANCYKVSQKKFLKELLSPDDVSDVLLGIEVLIRAINPSCVIINTVSPVRHIKDGIIENARSKAHLLAGVHEIIAPNKKSHYFPSYELMIDELRDYRFYKQDMVHPNDTSISIIWDRFKNTWIAPETNQLQKQIDTIQKGLQHRPFNEKSEAHLAFITNLQQKISEIQQKLPWVIFE